ncbi:MAG: hypothetical protein HC882_02800 [Acidobacteria bacterium]|nr:hypothetical protein [Acidobacteriota bacterium]
MAVHERRFVSYEGPETPERWRWLVIPRYALRDVFASRVFIFMFALGFIGPLLCFGLVYLKTRTGDLGQLGEFLSVLQIDRLAYRNMMRVQAVFAFLTALIVAPGMLYADIVGGGLPLYLARPISRAEYAFGKLVVPLALTSLLTWVPGVALFAFQSALEEPGWTWKNLSIVWAILVASGLLIVVLSLVGLACAAAVKSKLWSRALFLMVYFVSGGLGDTINLTFDTEWGSLLDIGALNAAVFTHLFDEGVTSGIPFGAALAAIAVVCAASIGILARRLRAFEIVR